MAYFIIRNEFFIAIIHEVEALVSCVIPSKECFRKIPTEKRLNACFCFVYKVNLLLRQTYKFYTSYSRTFFFIQSI